MMRVLICYLLVIVACAVMPCQARGEELFLPANRFSSSQINGIHQDAQGYIWVGSNNGLTRYDGYKFNKYYHDGEDPGSICDNMVSVMFTDREGNLWVGTNRGLARYDLAHDNFINYRFPTSSVPRVSAMVQTDDGTIIVGTSGRGLFYMDGESAELKPCRQPAENMYADFITHLSATPKGGVWAFATGNKVALLTVRRGEVVRCRPTENMQGNVVAILPGNDGITQIVTDKGIFQGDATGAVNVADYDCSTIPQPFTISSATRDRQGNLYLATDYGVYVIQPADGKAVKTELFSSPAAAGVPLYSLMEDRAHNIWATSFDCGVFVSYGQQSAFSNWRPLRNEVFPRAITAAVTTPSGDVICYVADKGILILDKSGRLKATAEVEDACNVLYVDCDGRCWMGGNTGLYHVDTVSGRATLEKNLGSGVHAIARDDNGKFYLGMMGDGVYIYDTRERESRHLTMNAADSADRITNDWVGRIMIDRNGVVWLSTSSGVSRYNTLSAKVEAPDLLPGVPCGDFLEMADGNVVIGSTKGLWLYDRSSGTVGRFPGSEVLDDINISDIVGDGHGDLWISSHKGLWNYDHKRGVFKRYMGHSGLSGHEYVSRTALKWANGRIGFASFDGILSFRPNEVKCGPSVQGKLQLSDVEIGGAHADPHQSHFTVSHEDMTISLQLSLFNYQNASNTLFEYRIDNGKWLSLGEGNNILSLTNMEPGDYHLQIRADADAETVADMLELDVTIRPAWYATPLAKLFYCLLAVALTVYAITGYLRRKRMELDEQKMQFLINATHDIRSPLTLITGPLKSLMRAISQLDPSVTGRNAMLADAQMIDHNTRRLGNLVEQILDQRRIDKNQLTLQVRPTNLVPFVAQICQLFRFSARQRNIKFSFHHADREVMAWIDHVQFDKVVCNLLSNAFKYSHDGSEINVLLSQANTTVTLCVLDTGMGIQETDTERLFDRFYQGKGAEQREMQGTGIGLSVCRTIVQMHHGSITAANRRDVGYGAAFTVTIPKGNAHFKPEEIVADVEAAQPALSMSTSAYCNLRIAIADDDEEISRYIINQLGGKFHFEAFANGEEALKALLTSKYDMVISDVVMPKMDGITLLKRIKGTPQICDTPVILLTMKSEVAHRLEGLKQGADAYIAKPFDIEELRVQIENLADNMRRTRARVSGAQSQEDKVEPIEMQSNNDALMERIMKSVNAHLAEPDFGVNEMADDIGMSRAHLHRKLKEMTGLSPSTFLRNIRLEQAARLIRGGGLDINQVAYAVGFKSPSYFTQAFKKQYGIRPIDYEVQNQQSSTPDKA